MEKNEQLEELHKKVVRMEQENEELHKSIGNYVILVNNKDRYAINLERELKNYQDLAAHYLEEIKGYQEQIESYQKQIEDDREQISYYQNLRVVKGYFRLRHFAGRVKRKIKKILGKQ